MELFIIACVLGVGIYIVSSEKRRMRESKLYKDWHEYYLNNGFNLADSERYATIMYRRGESLQSYGVTTKGETLQGYFSQSNITEPNATPYQQSFQTPEQKRASQMNSINLILTIASFLISFGMIIMIQQMNDRLVAPIFILITTLLYIVGVIVRLKVDFLKPVGNAFTYVALILIPFFAISFADLLGGVEMGNNFAYGCIISSAVSLISYALVAMLFNNSIAGSLSFFWFCCIFWSSTFTRGLPDTIEPYLLLMPPIFLSYISALIYTDKSDWVPTCFRRGVYALFKALPYWYIAINLSLFFIPNYGRDHIAFRAIYAGLITGLFAINYFAEKKYRNFISLRFLVQMFALAILADCLNFSIVNVYLFSNRKTYEWGPLWMSLAWAISFFLQALYSLFVKKRNKEDERHENNAGIVALVGIGSTLVISQALNSVAYGVVSCTVVGIVAVLGVLYAIFKKNLYWLYASLASFFILPFILDKYVFSPSSWETTHYFGYFSVAALISLLIYVFTQRIDKKKAINFALVSQIVFAFSIVCCGLDMVHFTPAVAVPAVCFTILSVISGDKKHVREATIYMIGLTCIAGIQDLIHALGNCGPFFTSQCADPIFDVQKFLQFVVFGATFLITSILYGETAKNNTKPAIRLGIGYYGFTIFGGLVAIVARANQNNFVLGIIYLLLQAGILGVSAFAQRRWTAVSSAIALVIGALYMSGLYNQAYIWIIMLGLALVGFAVWKLVAINNEDKKNQQNTPAKKH